MLHPARYTRSLLPVMAEMLTGSTRVLDPFAGTGERLAELAGMLSGVHVIGVEIEPKWAAITPSIVQVGNALSLPFEDQSFSSVVTSPTYGNRMADHHEARDSSKRNTYRHVLGCPLDRWNSGSLQWGEEYRRFHTKAWSEVFRVLRPGGVFVLNVTDHIRKHCVQPVTDWHVETLVGMGFTEVERYKIETPGNRQGANGNVRLGYEWVIKFRKEPV